MGSDFWIVVYWWTVMFLFGAVGFPLARRLFFSWWDQGYALAKAVGLAFGTWGVWMLASLHILPFTQASILGVSFALFVAGLSLNIAISTKVNIPLLKGISASLDTKRFPWIILIFEELFFFVLLLTWSWVKAHESSIRSLEKFMDFGFTQSILNSTFFPAPDMWYAGEPINYYYFGHTVMAVITKLSGLSLSVTYNLMLATLFAVTASLTFSIAVEILRRAVPVRGKPFSGMREMVVILGGLMTSYIVTLGGNLQTLYAFTKGYTGENPPPFWTLFWRLDELHRIPEGIAKYWYANATRFIPFTIHEFPSYSFAVSDVHGHVLSLPFVLLAFAMLLTFFVWGVRGRGGWGDKGYWGRLGLFGMLGGILFMTNALDGPIYVGLMAFLFTVLWWRDRMPLRKVFLSLFALGLSMGLAAAPFLAHFKSFVSGIGVNCSPAALANKRFFIFLFEGVDKCQHSPLWMLALLWGFFFYCFIWLYIVRIRKKKEDGKNGLLTLDGFLFFTGVFCFILLIIPEFFYFKDIYPAHFRSNTMFKLGYQAFIMLGIISGYTIVVITATCKRGMRILFWVFLLPLLFLVSVYPYFSVNSYFGNLRTYKTLDGLDWLSEEFPNDDAAISWLTNEFTSGRLVNRRPDISQTPVVVEADGESYTDYERVSAFTGLPTIVGWGVHEWLWRGTYDVVSPRREDVRRIYTETDGAEVKKLLDAYGVSYVFVGSKEREKFPDLNESLLRNIGKVVFRSGITTVYQVL